MSDGGEERIILFDGFCVLCSRLYRFVSTRDSSGRFRFVPIQSEEGRALAQRFGVDADNPETFVLIEGGRGHVRSEGMLRILRDLPGWRWTALLRGIPTAWRDRVYDLVARNRYRWFGRREACLVPRPHQRHRSAAP